MRLLVCLAAVALTASCGGNNKDDDLVLADICPDPVVIRTDWNPESEQGGAYELLERVVDTARGRVGRTLARR
jgi:hypothetical protein